MKKYTKTDTYTYITEFADGSIVLQSDTDGKNIFVSKDDLDKDFDEVTKKGKSAKEDKRGK